MTLLRRAAGVYAMLTAAAVGANFILTPLYDDGATGYPVWNVLNWFMAPAVVLAAAASLVWKLRPIADAARRIGTDALFYASAVLGLWFFWNWFGDLMSRDDTTMWAFIDPLFAVAVGACGVRLWRGSDEAS